MQYRVEGEVGWYGGRLEVGLLLDIMFEVVDVLG